VAQGAGGTLMQLHIGASMLRARLRALPPADARQLLQLLWPDLGDARVATIVANLGETRVSGAHFSMPASWDALLGDAS
jgi:hypothetical protein